MTLYKDKYRIESARLSGWDYSSPGYYFLTVCTHNRECLFGHIADNKMHLNEFGIIAQEEWDKSFAIRRELLPDEFAVMPNHFHGIVRLVDRDCNMGVPVDAGVVDATAVVDVAAVVVETSGRTSLQGRTFQPVGTSIQDRTVPNPSGPEPVKRQPKRPTPRIRPKSISSFMAGVKSMITKRINEIHITPGRTCFTTPIPRSYNSG